MPDIFDVSYKATLFYDSQVSPVEFKFKLILQTYVEILGIVPLELGASFSWLAQQPHYVVAEVLSTVQPLIMKGKQIAVYADPDTFFTAPHTLRFERAEALAIVNPNSYIALSIIDWASTSYFQADVYYRVWGYDMSEIPESITDYDKQDLPYQSAIFTPQKSTYGVDYIRFAERHRTFNYTLAPAKTLWVYDGCELEESHILMRANQYIWRTSLDPHKLYGGVADIISCHDDSEGYPISYQSLGNLFIGNIEVYASALPIVYYAPQGFVPFWGNWHIFDGLRLLGQFSPQCRELAEVAGKWWEIFLRERR
ncbi:MAG: hypothetical protein WBM69_20990 [Desulfobacterales bacterium]